MVRTVVGLKADRRVIIYYYWKIKDSNCTDEMAKWRLFERKRLSVLYSFEINSRKSEH